MSCADTLGINLSISTDWAGDSETGRSVGGYAIYLGKCLVSWKSKRQTTVATSTTAAEIEALYVGVLEGLWIEGLLGEIGLKFPKPTTWFEDNQGAIKSIESERNLDKTKHLLVKIYFLREQREKKRIQLEYKKTGEMVADIFTKALGKGLFEFDRSGLGMDIDPLVQGGVLKLGALAGQCEVVHGVDQSAVVG